MTDARDMRTHIRMYTFNYSIFASSLRLYSFQWFVLWLFFLPIFSCVWNFSMRHVRSCFFFSFSFFLFLHEYQSTFYISHHATAREFCVHFTRMNSRKEEKNMWKKQAKKKKRNKYEETDQDSLFKETWRWADEQMTRWNNDVIRSAKTCAHINLRTQEWKKLQSIEKIAFHFENEG